MKSKSMNIGKIITLFKSIDKLLNVLICIAIISILLIDLVLKAIPTPFVWMETLGNLYYQICLAYICSYIFYVLTVHIPLQKKKNILRISISNNLFWLYQLDIKLLMALRSNQKNQGTICDTRNLNIISKENIHKWGEENSFNSKVLVAGFGGSKSYNNWYEFLLDIKIEYNEIATLILLHQDIFEDEVIQRVLEAKELIDHWILKAPGIRESDRNLSYLCEGLFKFHEICQELYKNRATLGSEANRIVGLKHDQVLNNENTICYHQIIDDIAKSIDNIDFSIEAVQKVKTKILEYEIMLDFKFNENLLKSALTEKLEEDTSANSIAAIIALFTLVMTFGAEGIKSVMIKPYNIPLTIVSIILMGICTLGIYIFSKSGTKKRRRYLLIQEAIK